VVAIDDVQWLDPPSAQLVQFATRRVQAEPVRLLLARRGDGCGRAPLVHTVEAALTRIYIKLGVRSRTELTRHLAARPKDLSDAS
jgi:hypothetical protein